MDSSSKTAKDLDESQEDRISNLPDEVLIKILSLVSTIDAFQTSILSPRWKDLWALVPNLSFYPKNRRTERYTSEAFKLEYTNFIDRVLLRHNSSIHQFHLYCTPEIDKSRFNAWINTLVKHDIRDISLSGHTCPNLPLPRSLLTCRTLEILKLDINVQFNVPSTIDLPRLRVLHIELSNPSKDLTEKLICSSPMLEELKFEVKDDSGRTHYIISSPALKKLSVHIRAKGLEDYSSVVTIEAPLLEVLELSNRGFCRYTLKNTLSIVKASVKQTFSGRRSRELSNLYYMLLTQMSNVKCLTLDDFSIADFKAAKDKKWPIFYNVTQLNLEGSASRFTSRSLFEWPNFPNLRHLQLYVSGDLVCKSETLIIMRFQKISSTSQCLGEFDPSEQGMPTCLQSYVKEIEIWKLGCWPKEMKLIEYLLECAHMLEKLNIELRKRVRLSEEEIQMQILAMPMSSKTCQYFFV